MLADGTVDLVISHAPETETRYLAEHRDWQYRKIAFNHFLVVGPRDDPAHVREARDIAEAFKRIAASGAPSSPAVINRGRMNASSRCGRPRAFAPSGQAATDWMHADHGRQERLQQAPSCPRSSWWLYRGRWSTGHDSRPTRRPPTRSAAVLPTAQRASTPLSAIMRDGRPAHCLHAEPGRSQSAPGEYPEPIGAPRPGHPGTSGRLPAAIRAGIRHPRGDRPRH